MDSDLLLHRAAPVAGADDYRGRPASGSSAGGWTAALFIIVFEMAERFAFYGISSNLISFLTGPLGEPTAAAAASVNAWSGAAMMLPLLGAFLADSYLGRYTTIVFSSCLYILGLAFLMLSAVLPTIQSPNSHNTMGPTACPPSHFQVTLFYFSLYLVAFAQGGHKPCLQAFGADQFGQSNPEELKSKSSFFNWWCFGINSSVTFSIIILSYVQDDIGWGLGFGLPCIVMGIALVIFLLGRTYRYYLMEDANPFCRLGRSFGVWIRKWRSMLIKASKEVRGESPILLAADQLKFLDGCNGLSAAKEDEDLCTSDQLEEARGILRLFPIWASCLIYTIVFAQASTFFTKQGSTLDRKIGKSFQIPPAALQAFIGVSIAIFIPIYDRIIVPLSRNLSPSRSGITMLQRIGIGMVLSAVSMVIAASVEMKRLRIAREFRLVDRPEVTVPMSFWWLVPQYILFGAADVFTLVGMQEFFYDQVPDALRSIGVALSWSVFGVGSFMSGFLITLTNRATGWRGESWFPNNLNQAHLDYFYWLLAGLSVVGFATYLFFAQSYVYKKERKCEIV